MERDAIGRARAAMSAVDVHLRGSIISLETLAASTNLESGDIAAFMQKALSAEMIMKGLMGWLKADTGVVVQDGKVSAWQDLSGRGMHAIQANPAERPTVVANALQGAPAIRFDGLASNLMIK